MSLKTKAEFFSMIYKVTINTHCIYCDQIKFVKSIHTVFIATAVKDCSYVFLILWNKDVITNRR